jgi:hypothetical protein
MSSPTAEERSRLACVAPWSMVSIIVFGFMASRFGIFVALPSVLIIVIAATFFFPKGGVAATRLYKVAFVFSMMACFICIITLTNLVSRDYEKAVWLGSYFVGIGIIGIVGMVLEHTRKS